MRWPLARTLSFSPSQVMRRIESGEAKIQQRIERASALGKKVSRTKNPWLTLRIDYGSAATRGKQYTEENDRFLVCMTHQLGYGRWEELRDEVRNSWLFRFDWFVKTRTPQELSRRVETLARAIEKEMAEVEAAEEAERKSKNKKGAAAKGGKRAAEPEAAPAGKRSRR